MAVQFGPAIGMTLSSVTLKSSICLVPPTATAARRSSEKAPSQAMPNSETAMPKWAMTMPHVATGTRVSLRPFSGSTAATASAAARPRPSSGSSGYWPKKLTSAITPITSAAISASSNWRRAGLSLFQRNSGPTAITSSIGIAKIAEAGLK